MHYDVTIITVQPGTHPEALARLAETLPCSAGGDLLACWYSEIGALNRILMIRAAADFMRIHADRMKMLMTENPFGIGEYIVGLSMDTYVSFPFIQPMKAGRYGPVFEVRTYVLKPDGVAATIELWRESVPGRVSLSPLLAAMHSITGTVTRFMHIWPYADLNERARLRAKAVADKLWPPPGGPDHLATMQSDIYFPADFSPIH
jgi:NIPSNAP